MADRGRNKGRASHRQREHAARLTQYLAGQFHFDQNRRHLAGIGTQVADQLILGHGGQAQLRENLLVQNCGFAKRPFFRESETS